MGSSDPKGVTDAFQEKSWDWERAVGEALAAGRAILQTQRVETAGRRELESMWLRSTQKMGNSKSGGRIR